MGFEKYGIEQKKCLICGEPIQDEEYKKFQGLCRSCYILEKKEKPE